MKIQACVMAPADTVSPAATRAAAAEARRSVSTASSCPTRSAKTSLTPRMVLRPPDTSRTPLTPTSPEPARASHFARRTESAVPTAAGLAPPTRSWRAGLPDSECRIAAITSGGSFGIAGTDHVARPAAVMPAHFGISAVHCLPPVCWELVDRIDAVISARAICSGVDVQLGVLAGAGIDHARRNHAAVHFV